MKPVNCERVATGLRFVGESLWGSVSRSVSFLLAALVPDVHPGLPFFICIRLVALISIALSGKPTDGTRFENRSFMAVFNNRSVLTEGNAGL